MEIPLPQNNQAAKKNKPLHVSDLYNIKFTIGDKVLVKWTDVAIMKGMQRKFKSRHGKIAGDYPKFVMVKHGIKILSYMKVDILRGTVKIERVGADTKGE